MNAGTDVAQKQAPATTSVGLETIVAAKGLAGLMGAVMERSEEKADMSVLQSRQVSFPPPAIGKMNWRKLC